MPFTYAVIIPLILLDAVIELYHRVCFPLFGITLVPRKSFILVDRHKLRYLTYFERLNCMYCGYANGLLAYAKEISARTEAFWCAIKHRANTLFLPPAHHAGFLEYNDEAAYRAYKRGK